MRPQVGGALKVDVLGVPCSAVGMCVYVSVSAWCVQAVAVAVLVLHRLQLQQPSTSGGRVDPVQVHLRGWVLWELCSSIGLVFQGAVRCVQTPVLVLLLLGAAGRGRGMWYCARIADTVSWRLLRG